MPLVVGVVQPLWGVLADRRAGKKTVYMCTRVASTALLLCLALPAVAASFGRTLAVSLAMCLFSSGGVLDAYAKALNTSIDDAFTFMENAMRGTATTPFIARAIAALDHETTTPGRNLASVVDAITLEAQNEDLFTQADMEALAADLLRRGLSQARGERILVEA